MKKNVELVPITNFHDAVAPAGWAEDYAKYLTRDTAAATGGTGWPWLSTKDKVNFKLGEVNFGAAVDVVVLGAIRENAYYAGVFDPNNTSGPDCFALNLGMDEAFMAPPADLEAKESDKCSECWANAFGSDDRGRGKACKNTVRLALLYHEAGSDFSKVEGARLRVSPTSLGHWSAYVGQIAKGLQRPLFSVVTRISLEPDDVTQFKLHFQPVGVYNDDETLEVLKARADEAIDQLEQLPEANTGDAAPKPSGGKPKGRRKVTRKKITRKARG